MEIFFQSAALAVIEGLTEFIPVSSTGHMIILGDFIGFTGDKAAAFEIFIQLGAILAVVFIYWQKYFGLLPLPEKGKSFFQSLFLGESRPNATHFLLAVVPILMVGYVFHPYIKTYLFSPVTVAIGLIVGGILMIIVERLPFEQTVSEVEDINYKQAFWIGLGQCLALWPGMSRSGSTMIVALLFRVKHKAGADFSFLIAVPVMIAAVSYDLYKSWSFLDVDDIGYFIMGFVLAFIIAWASVKWFLKVLSRFKLTPFGIYRILIGVFTLWLFY